MNLLNQIEQLEQLKTATWDGDLISKSCRDQLIKYGYATKSSNGWNVITPTGLDYLHSLDKLSTNRKQQLSSQEEKQPEPYGYVFENKFYKSLDELSGQTFFEGNEPVAVYRKEQPAVREEKQTRELSEITDEDAIEVAKIYGWTPDNSQRFQERVLQFKIDLPCIGIAGYKHKHLLQVFQYLESKGYKLPRYY